MAQTNLDRYKADLNKLTESGKQLLFAIEYECHPEAYKKQLIEVLGDKEKADKFIKDLPKFRTKYQDWYSEAQSLVKQILPNRFDDFVALYEKPKNRKLLDHGTYVIADYLQGLIRQNGMGETIVAVSSAIPQFTQQLNIVRSAQGRFESSLFDIKQLVQADLFDSELAAAAELLKAKFGRAAGAIAGVVLEKHLQQTCETHKVKLTKKDPTIAVFNDALKNDSVIDTPQWRFIQRLGDLRNLCDHNKGRDPTTEEVSDLISGVEKLTKTLF